MLHLVWLNISTLLMSRYLNFGSIYSINPRGSMGCVVNVPGLTWRQLETGARRNGGGGGSTVNLSFLLAATLCFSAFFWPVSLWGVKMKNPSLTDARCLNINSKCAYKENLPGRQTDSREKNYSPDVAIVSQFIWTYRLHRSSTCGVYRSRKYQFAHPKIKTELNLCKYFEMCFFGCDSLYVLMRVWTTSWCPWMEARWRAV